MADVNLIHKTFYQIIKTGDKYGVLGKCGNESISVENLTHDYKVITKFVALLNAEELELCHLKEVAWDFLYSKELFTV